MGKKKEPLATTDIKIIVGHLRKLVSSPDPLSILVRGMILIDDVLQDLIEAVSAIPYSKIEDAFDHPGLLQKAVLACSMGAISQGELACIREINTLRNSIAHRLAVDIAQRDEERIVNVFKNQTLVFSGLTYDATGFPKTLIFLLMILFEILHIRATRDGIKIAHTQDENVEVAAAIVIVQSLSEVVRKNAEADDAAITEILERHANEAKRYRDEHASVDPAHDS
jgi:hypothetical protein